MLPWLREIEGFDGLLMLTDEEAATTLAIAFWADRAWPNGTERLAWSSATASRRP